MAVQEDLDLWGSQPVGILLTIKQTAQMLSLSRSTIYELIGGGVLEVVHVAAALGYQLTPSSLSSPSCVPTPAGDGTVNAGRVDAGLRPPAARGSDGTATGGGPGEVGCSPARAGSTALHGLSSRPHYTALH